jgi:purine-binding chemotaxis protein CheW
MNRDHASWDDLYATLRETADILDQGDALSADTLEQRTRQLSREAGDPERGRDTLRVLTFSLAGERYGWPVGRVRTIARIGRITPVPSAPAYYRGVISLRGQVLSVMDLRVYLGMPPLQRSDNADGDFMIVIDGAGLEIGVLASEVYDVLTVPLHALAPASSAGLDAELVIGVTTEGLTLLDAETLLNREHNRIESEDNQK